MSTFIVAVTGASGSLYAAGLVGELLRREEKVALLVTKQGRVVLKEELGLDLPWDTADVADAFRKYLGIEGSGEIICHDNENLAAPIASGTFKARAMVVVPCSMGTIARIAMGLSTTLLERSADVMLKEKRPLVIVPRETPLNAVHLKNMLALAELGAHLIPAMPAFYHHPESIGDLRDFLVGRILDVLDVPHGLYKPWGM